MGEEGEEGAGVKEAGSYLLVCLSMICLLMLQLSVQRGTRGVRGARGARGAIGARGARGASGKEWLSSERQGRDRQRDRTDKHSNRKPRPNLNFHKLHTINF